MTRYYILSAVLMVICFCIGVFTEKHFADKEIEMLRTRKVRPAQFKKNDSLDFPETRKLAR